MTTIEDFLEDHILGVFKLSEQVFGEGYYTSDELSRLQQNSQLNGINASKVLIDQGEILGVRLTKPPGLWKKGKGVGLTTESWPHSLSETAYFQSLFLSEKVRRQGKGTELSKKSIESLRTMGAKGVVCHSWMESPGNGSSRYLKSMGFRLINKWPEYWKEVEYTCQVCGRPCTCTAEEMYLDIKGFE